MNKKIIILVPFLIAFISLGYWVYQKHGIQQSPKQTFNPIVFDPMNASYSLEGEIVSLFNGQEEKDSVPGSASKPLTIAWNQVAKADLNGDGLDDAALALIRNLGGSGTFFYLTVALSNQDKQAIGINAVFLGDRIVMQDISIANGVIAVQYLDRAQGEAMAAEPSIKVNRSFVVESNILKELNLTK